MIVKSLLFALITFGITLAVALLVASIVKLIGMAVKGKQPAAQKAGTAPPTKS